MASHIIIATRGSELALWQAEFVKNCLQDIDPGLKVSLNIIRTKGDMFLDAPLSQFGGKGLFVKEIEQALEEGRADIAVHSMKDVPMELPNGLIIGCVPKRADPADCFVSEKYPALESLPPGSTVGTSSLRRQAQLLSIRPDLSITMMRGNIDTRLKKMAGGDCDAIILAAAGLKRLGLSAAYMQELDPDKFVPAVGQGALGIECHEDNYQVLALLANLEDRNTRVCVQAERAFLGALNGCCKVPIGGYARMLDEENISLEGLVAEPDGTMLIRGDRTADAVDAEKTGRVLAEELLLDGADEILKKLDV